MSVEINYIFSMGWRCSATLFLHSLGLRSFSSPFDNMFCDLESSLRLSKNKMNGFLDNIIMIKQDQNQIYLVREGMIHEVPDNFKKLNEQEIMWDYKSWKDHRLFINTEYNPKGELSQDVNTWDPIWVMIHDDLREKDMIETYNRRITRFNKIIEKFPEKTMLFFLSKVLDFDDFAGLQKRYIDLLDKYSPEQYVCLVLCSDKIEEETFLFYKEKYLLLFKRVPSLKEQQKNGGLTENDTDKVDFTREISLIRQHFHLDII